LEEAAEPARDAVHPIPPLRLVGDGLALFPPEHVDGSHLREVRVVRYLLERLLDLEARRHFPGDARIGLRGAGQRQESDERGERDLRSQTHTAAPAPHPTPRARRAGSSTSRSPRPRRTARETRRRTRTRRPSKPRRARSSGRTAPRASLRRLRSARTTRAATPRRG